MKIGLLQLSPLKRIFALENYLKETTPDTKPSSYSPTRAIKTGGLALTGFWIYRVGPKKPS